ncbi:LytR C-terminal domain-containing protein [Mycobacterium sp.]|uniref:LytR C-terminal domain-containing protein n=1 Tax=Mycobacterium sp. TaxID=1785 RepID=UPI0012825ECE|nr:LytR C-terminal domain-containing protein [Mycobacterium sp.]KAA8966898.1 MAG: LytR family transcriptional regulator [Mycobacterium sp.]
MTERVPDSAGLPLRAMVMVLLFLGVIFLLFGFQAMGSGGNAGDEGSALATLSTSSVGSKPSEPAAPNIDVRVYNISHQEGAAGRVADQLRAAGYTVPEVGNLSLPAVATTTVYYADAAGEREAAAAVGKLLGAPVEPRIPEVADQPPGVIVVVAS